MDSIEEFIQQIDRIPNTSDKILCRTTVAAEFEGNKYSDMRDKILDETELLIDTLDSVSEKILRLVDMADSIHKKNSTKEKRYIQKALDLISNSEDKNLEAEKNC